MAEQYRAKRTSEEISRWDAASYPGGINRYAEELRDAIERELREWGECPLLERLDRERPHISVPLFEVLQSVRRRQKNGAAPAASGNRSFAEILQQKYGFDPKSWIRSFYKYSSVEQLVDELRAAGHRAMDRTEHRSVPITEKEGTGDTSVPVSVAGQPSPAEESRRTPAVREAREEREPSPAGPAAQTASSAEAEQILAEAGKEAGALLAEARREAAEITGDARRRAEEILEGAKREAAALLEDARQKRERSRAEAEAFREQTMERARLDARQETGRLTQRYLTEAQRRERIGTARPTPEEADALTRIDRLHDDMCGRTNALQVGWVKAIDEMTERLSDMKSELYRHLRSWQVGLYPLELRPLAERYTELYRILNVEGLISEEIVWLSKHGGQAAAGVPAEGEAQAPDVVGRLRELNETLTTFLSMYENSLHGLGLYAFFPQEGDAFRPGWHVCARGAAGGGRTIAACVVPGVSRRGTDGEDDVLVPATVELKKEENQHDADRA